MALIPRRGLTLVKDNSIYLKQCSNLSDLQKMGQDISPAPDGAKANLSGATCKHEHVVQPPLIRDLSNMVHIPTSRGPDSNNLQGSSSPPPSPGFQAPGVQIPTSKGRDFNLQGSRFQTPFGSYEEIVKNVSSGQV